MAARLGRVDQGARRSSSRLQSTPTTSRPSSSTSRPGGLTEADLAAMDEQAAEMSQIDGVTDEGALSPDDGRAGGHPGPFVSEDGEVAQTCASPSTSARTAGTTCPTPPRSIRDIAQIDGVTVHLAGYGGQAADSAEAFDGIDTNLLAIALGVVIIILLFTYRSPLLWLLPILSVRRGVLVSGGARLPPREVRRPHGQRPEPGDHEHPGDRRRHRLRAAARGAISRRAPSPRGPARGDGVRAAPRRARDPGQRRHRRDRHALPAVRRDELHRRSRPGHRRSASPSPTW